MNLQISANLLCKYIKEIENRISLSLIDDRKYLRGKRSFKNSKQLPLLSTVKLLLTPMLSCLSLILIRSPRLANGSSKSAFVQARGKVSPEYFKILNDHLVSLLQSGQETSHLYKGYGLYGIDGTTIYLPQTPGCRNAFGVAKNQHGEQCYARAALCANLLTRECLGIEHGRYNASELELAKALYSRIPARSICVMDRLYPSGQLFYTFDQQNQYFLIRCKVNFNRYVKDFVKSGKSDDVVEMKISQRAITPLKRLGYDVTCNHQVTVRLIRVSVPNSEDYILITNVLDPSMTIDDFAKIYQMRWKMETIIDCLKNKFRLEHFSGHKVLHVEQDIQAVVCKYNAMLGLYRIAQKELDEKDKDKEVKRRVNMNLTIHLFADLLKASPENEDERIGFCKCILQCLVRNPESVRTGRSFPRSKKYNKARGRCWFNYNYKYSA